MSETLFTSQTPASADVDNGNSISLGTYFTPAVDGVVSAVRFYFPASAQAGGEAVKGALFRTSDSVKVGSDQSFATPGTAGAWNQVSLSPPVSVTGGVQYCAAVRVPNRYVASTGGASPWPLTNGNLSAPTGAGRFEDADGDGSVQFPTDSFNEGCYFVDVVFDAGSPAVEGSTSQTATLAGSSTASVARAGASSQTDTFTGSSTASVARAGASSQTVALAGSSAATVTPGGASSQAVALAGSSTAMVVHNAQTSGGLILAGSSTPEQAAAPVHRGNWGSLRSVYEQAIADQERIRTEPIRECPNHLEPLEPGRADGTVHCRFGGEVFDLHGNPVLI